MDFICRDYDSGMFFYWQFRLKNEDGVTLTKGQINEANISAQSNQASTHPRIFKAHVHQGWTCRYQPPPCQRAQAPGGQILIAVDRDVSRRTQEGGRHIVRRARA